jgi:mono/diheme cytochrome c family protein
VTESPFAVVGLFNSPRALLEAIPQLRDKDPGLLEAYSPYPVHGVAEALGLRRSPLGGVVLVMGLVGGVSALLFQWWASGVDYPLITGGKSATSWQAFVPIMFELTVLFAAFTAAFAMLLLFNRLPAWGHAMLASRAIGAVTRDRFALSLEARPGTRLDVEAAAQALRAAGATAVEVVNAPLEPKVPTVRTLLSLALGAVVLCLVLGYATYWIIKLFPALPPMAHMSTQPRLDPQQASFFFKDGRGMRLPVEETVARGFMPHAPMTDAEAVARPNPLPRSAAILERGRKSYDTFCIVCHGPLADGTPRLSAAYGAKPANLQSAQFRDSADGMLYRAVMEGKNAMPSYATLLDDDEIWAVVHYVRALQLAQNARDEDLR